MGTLLYLEKTESAQSFLLNLTSVSSVVKFLPWFSYILLLFMKLLTVSQSQKGVSQGLKQQAKGYGCFLKLKYGNNGINHNVGVVWTR